MHFPLFRVIFLLSFEVLLLKFFLTSRESDGLGPRLAAERAGRFFAMNANAKSDQNAKLKMDQTGPTCEFAIPVHSNGSYYSFQYYPEYKERAKYREIICRNLDIF